MMKKFTWPKFISIYVWSIPNYTLLVAFRTDFRLKTLYLKNRLYRSFDILLRFLWFSVPKFMFLDALLKYSWSKARYLNKLVVSLLYELVDWSNRFLQMINKLQKYKCNKLNRIFSIWSALVISVYILICMWISSPLVLRYFGLKLI